MTMLQVLGRRPGACSAWRPPGGHALQGPQSGLKPRPGPRSPGQCGAPGGPVGRGGAHPARGARRPPRRGGGGTRKCRAGGWQAPLADGAVGPAAQPVLLGAAARARRGQVGPDHPARLRAPAGRLPAAGGDRSGTGAREGSASRPPGAGARVGAERRARPDGVAASGASLPSRSPQAAPHQQPSIRRRRGSPEARLRRRLCGSLPPARAGEDGERPGARLERPGSWREPRFLLSVRSPGHPSPFRVRG